MWNFSQYKSKERALNGLSQGSSKVTKAGVGARAGIRARTQTSRTALKIRYKSSSKYLRTLLTVAEATTTGDFTL